MVAQASVRPAITDSPWFWLCLFCTAALIALVAMDRRYGARQAQIERQYQGRQRALQQRAGQEPSTPMSTSRETLITLWPLYAILAMLLLAGWVFLGCTHLGRTGEPPPSKPPENPA